MSKKDKSDCEFCRIISDDSNSHIVFEDDLTLSFLDNRPLFPGHCLLIPKEHIITVNDLDEVTRNTIFTNMQLLNRAVEKAMGAEGTFIAINNKISQSVPHLHIHIVPRRRKDGLKGFFWPRNPYTDEKHIEEVQGKLVETVKKLKESALPQIKGY